MFLRKENDASDFETIRCCVPLSFLALLPDHSDFQLFREVEELTEEDVGLLVPLGFDITAFTPAAYQRGSLPRPS